MMKRDKLADESKDILPPNVIKGALKQASISDLLNEAFQRGLTMEAQQEPAPGSDDETAPDTRMRRWETLRRKKLQERQLYLQERGEQSETSDIDEEIELARASTAKHNEYVGALFDVLRRERIKKMRDLGIQREDTTPEFALLGSSMTKAIFEHLVVIRRNALDAGACDIESLWDYFMGDAGYRFAEGIVKGDPHIPPDLWSSFIYTVIQDAAIKEAAALSKCSYVTIWRAVANGKLKATAIGNHPRIIGSELLKWIEDGGKTGRSRAVM